MLKSKSDYLLLLLLVQNISDFSESYISEFEESADSTKGFHHKIYVNFALLINWIYVLPFHLSVAAKAPQVKCKLADFLGVWKSLLKGWT